MKLKKILVAYDGSASASNAFRFALELAQAFGSSLLVISVAQLPEPATMVESSAMMEAAREHFEKDFNNFRSAASSAQIPIETKIVVGHPGEQIVHCATQEAADLIVMGHRGKGVVQRWLLGSISDRVINYATCSVTIVR